MIYKESKINLLKETLIKKCPIDHNFIKKKNPQLELDF
jgi:hypothetical protein